MRVRHHPSVDSDMSRYWRSSDVFELCDDFSHPVLTLTGAELVQIIQAHYAQAAVLQDTIQALTRDARDLYPKRRLLGQHKALKGRGHPSSPTPAA